MVACSFETVVRLGFSPFGTTTIDRAGTFPDSPGTTASTPTFLVDGITTKAPSTIPTSAGGSSTVERVRNSIPDAVLTIDPAGIVFELPVLRLENVTVPVAGVSSTFRPVAGNVDEVSTSNRNGVAGTRRLAGSGCVMPRCAATLKWSGPMTSLAGTRVTVALGSWVNANAPPTTSATMTTAIPAIRPLRLARWRAGPTRGTIGGSCGRRIAAMRIVGSSGAAGGPSGGFGRVRLAAVGSESSESAPEPDAGPTSGAAPPRSKAATETCVANPADAASARAEASFVTTSSRLLRLSASRARSRKLIRDVASREPSGRTRAIRSSGSARIRAAADVISSSTSR